MWRVIWEHGLSPLQMVGSLYSCLCISYHLSLSLSVSLLHALAWMQCLPMVGPLNDDCAFQSNLLTFKKRAASLLSCITITWLKKPEDRQRLPPPANLWTGIRAKSQLLFARFRLWTPGSWCLSRFKKAVSCPHAALKPEASVPFQLVPHHSVKLSFYMWGKGKSVMSDSLRPRVPGFSVRGGSPGKNTGVGCHSLLQEIFLTQGSNSGLPHCRQILCHLSHQGNLIYEERLPNFQKSHGRKLNGKVRV